MPPRRQWVLLAYRLPREPSTPRIAVWRRLRQLGAAQLGDGLAALPHDPRTREHFEWLGQFVEEADGEATVWISEPASARQHRELADRMNEAVGADYRKVIEAANAARSGNERRRRQTMLRLRRTLERVKARDFFRSSDRREAESAVAELNELVEAER